MDISSESFSSLPWHVESQQLHLQRSDGFSSHRPTDKRAKGRTNSSGADTTVFLPQDRDTVLVKRGLDCFLDFAGKTIAHRFGKADLAIVGDSS